MKKILKKLLVGCLLLLLHTSCAVINTPVTGFSEQMIVLKERFPELYDLHSQGKIVIWSMWRQEKERMKRMKRDIRSYTFKTTFARAIRSRYKYLYLSRKTR